MPEPGLLPLLAAALLGLATTSSSLIGAALGLYSRLSERGLACVLGFAAGSLISALAIELAFESAETLHNQGYAARAAWAFVAGGFAVGALIYYRAALYLEGKGAAIRNPARFREFAEQRKREDNQELIRLLSRCDLLRHLPPEDMQQLLPLIRVEYANAGTTLFYAGDAANALYIVARGEIEILAADDGRLLARLDSGQAFGEMALLHGGERTATARVSIDSELLAIAKHDFDHLIKFDPQLAHAVERLSHSRALSNLSAGGPHSATCARLATAGLDRVTRHESDRLLKETGSGAGLAIVFGNILDTIPGCLVIGAKFVSLETISLSLALGMFIGGIPEAAASAAMLRKAGYSPRAIFGLWSTVLVAGFVAAAIGKAFLGSSEALLALFCEAIAGGAVLALVAHAMIPEAIEDAGSAVVLPTVGGFLFGLYLSLSQAFGT
ncbi:MAG TPA: cyclic nucleotide-binding domain-containing protein [Stellaceae bacterium]|jgi:zinc transporter ZupT|nr:cyclic nucleotide-binding domain-containing protein [Stellaceae bacterium]